MTDSELLAAIKANATAKKEADAGNDAGVADTLNAALPAAVPIITALLMQAAPTTLTAIASGGNPLSEMEVIAARVRERDAAGIGSWAATLHLLGKMNDAEFAAVESLAAAAAAGDAVDHTQVSRVLYAVRPVVDGAPRGLPIDWSKVS